MSLFLFKDVYILCYFLLMLEDSSKTRNKYLLCVLCVSCVSIFFIKYTEESVIINL